MSYQTGRVRGKVRDTIFGSDGRKCAYCFYDLTKLPRPMWTIDHIVPRSKGGSNDPSNLISSCFWCNSRRRDTPIYRFVGKETLVRLIRDYPRVAATIVETMTEDGNSAAV
jgi:5-methylcytosine-specific restriction endonuclease McrA